MKITAKDILKPALILFVICLVVTALLAGTNLLTKDKIAEQSALEAEQSRKVVLSDADSFEEADGYYIGKANNETVGYVFQTEAKGYGGAVKVMTGISADGQITGVVILEHSETPGLGANAEKASFTDQFKQTAPEKGITLVKNKAPSDGEIEAMTGRVHHEPRGDERRQRSHHKVQHGKGGRITWQKASKKNLQKALSKRTPCCA